MFGFDEHYSINVSHYENEEELDHKLKKHIRQLEGEHKIQRAVQEQKIELLEMKLREFEEREAGLKKMNSEILVTLGDLNKKEDSALMNKVFEELAIANKEKLREKKQQQTKFQALKSQLELTISELKGKLAQSDREKKEMELEYKEKILMYEDELEQERKAHETLKREFEEKRGHVKGNEEMQRLKKRIAVLEEENNGLKKEFEKETGRMKFQFERNLADLKEIHGEERSSFEARLKKTKEQLVKAEEESDAKAAAERELMREVASLREKIIEMEINSIGEIDRIMNEKDAALEKIKELEKGLEELKKNYEKEQKEQNNACNISSAELFAQNLEERLRHLEEKEQKETMSFKTPNNKAESKNTLCEQASVDHLPVFTNLESQMPSLASSMVHEHFVTEKKKAMAAIANQPIIGPDFSRCWTHEDLMKMVYSKPNTRSNSRHDLNYVSQPQTPKCNHNEVDHHRKSIIKSVCAHSEKPENLITPENKVYMEKEPQCSCQISGHQFREWALKDTSYAKNNCADPTHVRRQSRVSEDECGVSYRNDSHIGTEPWNYDKAVPKRGERVQNSFRSGVNYSDKVYMKNEGPMLRRNGSNGMVENSIRRDFSNDRFDDHCNMSVMMKDDEGQVYDPNRKLFRDGIHEVMTGLRNIKTRLEKQQEDIMVAKNVSINCEINKRARSISNVKVRPNVMPRDVLNQNSFYIEGNYRGNERSRGYLGRLDMNRSAYVTDENSISMHNASQYGDNKKYVAESLQASYRGRTPVLMRENNRTPFLSRHRNSLV